jgi:hypothetical protein
VRCYCKFCIEDAVRTVDKVAAYLFMGLGRNRAARIETLQL